MSTKELPVNAYRVLAMTYCGIFGALLVSRRGRLPARLSTRDMVLLGIATHRLSRLLARDRIAVGIREPFTKVRGGGGAGELVEEPRGHGLQRAIGSLLTCQFCLDPWIAAVLAAGFVARPRETRMIASVFGVVTIADFVHQLYAGARTLSD